MADNLQQTDGNQLTTTILTVEATTSTATDNAIDLADKKLDQVGNSLENKFDGEVDQLQTKLDSVNTTALNNKIDSFVTDVMSFASNSMGGFTTLAQKAVDGVILNSSVPEPLKTELVKDVNFGLSTVSSEVKKDVEALEKRGEALLANDLPIVEHKVASFLKDFLTKVKHAANNMIEHCESTSHKLGVKLKAFFHHHSQDDVINAEDTTHTSIVNVENSGQKDTLLGQEPEILYNSVSSVSLETPLIGVVPKGIQDSNGDLSIVL